MLLSAQQLLENTVTGVSRCLFPFSPGAQADCLPLVLLLGLASGYTGLGSAPTYNFPKNSASPKHFTGLGEDFSKVKKNNLLRTKKYQ